MRLEIGVRGHRVGILGRIGVEVACHQPQRFHRIAADGAVEDAVDLPVAVGVARPGCALPVGIGSEGIEVQHHDVDVLDAGVDGSVPEGNVFEQAVAQFDGVFRRQPHRKSALLAEYGVGVPVAAGKGRERLLGECVALAEGHEVGVLLLHPVDEVVEVLGFVEFHALENIVTDETQGFGLDARSRIGRQFLVRCGGIVVAGGQQGRGREQRRPESQPAQHLYRVVCFHVVRWFICCNAGLRRRR